jgi:hypothetical protein
MENLKSIVSWFLYKTHVIPIEICNLKIYIYGITYFLENISKYDPTPNETWDGVL